MQKIPKLQTTEYQLPVDHQHRERIAVFQRTVPNFHFRQSIAWLGSSPSSNACLFVTEDESNNIFATSLVDINESMIPGVSNASVVRGPLYEQDLAAAKHIADVLSAISPRCTSFSVSPFIDYEKSESIREILTSQAFHESPANNQYDYTVVAPVLPSSESQWRSLRRSFRTSVNKSKKLKIQVTEKFSREQYHDFLLNFNDFARKRNISTLPEDIVTTIYENFSKRDPALAHLLSAELSGNTLGQILLLHNGDQLVYEWGWTAPREIVNRAPVMHSLIWHALEMARRLGVASIDLGGFWNDLGDTSPINQFKLGISKNIVRFLPEFEYICSPTKHRLQSSLRKIRSTLTSR